MKLYRSLAIWLGMVALLFSASPAPATTLRIVSYNIDCADQGNDNNITGPTHSLPTVIQAIGLHHLGTNAQQVDVLNVEELNSTTLSNFVFQLNAIYGSGAYAYDLTKDTNTGGGPDGIIYNTHTVQVVSARSLPDGDKVLLQSDGTYAFANNSPGGGTNGVTRSPMLYQVRPLGFGTTNDFYMYVSHARSTSDDSIGDARYAEAQEVRSDAKYNLPAGSHILYAGDWNLFAGGYENAYKCLTGQITSDGTNWSDGSAIWANTNQTQAYDPMSKTVPPTTVSWTNSSADHANYLYDDSTDAGKFATSSRLDIQLPNALMFGAYNGRGGVQLAPDTSDPFDHLNFPSSQYPYAFETFGNNGSVAISNTVTSASNNSLDDLTNATPNATTVYSDILLTNSGTSSVTGSDHYPIFGDYNIVLGSVVVPPAPPVLTAQGFTNGNFLVQLLGSSNTTFGFQASTNMTNWAPIGSGSTDPTGLLLFQDTNASLFSNRFYRAHWPAP